jgi:transposase-like protein
MQKGETKRKKQYGTHFLNTAAAVRSLDMEVIYAMTEEQAYAELLAIRFESTNGEPVCPTCNCPAYILRTRKCFKCKNCPRQFSLTSNTPLAGRKLSCKKIVRAAAYYAIGSIGRSGGDCAQLLSMSRKAAWVFHHRLREALAKNSDRSQLVGEVEFDNAEVGGHIRPKNIKKFRKDRRKIENRSDSKLFVAVARERTVAGGRPGRTYTTVVTRQPESAKFVEKAVSRSAIHYSDLGGEWSSLRRRDLRQVNHKSAYVTPYSHTNNAECYFSMLRRVERIHGHIGAPRYLHSYTEDLNFRQNRRRDANTEKYISVLRALLSIGTSSMTGYWQGRRRKAPS